MQFTEKQLRELEVIFGIKRQANTIKVRDGVIQKGMPVWFRNPVTGPVHTNSADPENWEHICEFPKAYQISTPRFNYHYLD